MKLQVVSLKGVEFEGEVSSVNLMTTSGEITVLDNHQPLITQLTKGQAIVTKKDGETLNLDIVSGFIEVGMENRVSILIS